MCRCLATGLPNILLLQQSSKHVRCLKMTRAVINKLSTIAATHQLQFQPATGWSKKYCAGHCRIIAELCGNIRNDSGHTYIHTYIHTCLFAQSQHCAVSCSCGLTLRSFLFQFCILLSAFCNSVFYTPSTDYCGRVLQ